MAPLSARAPLSRALAHSWRLAERVSAAHLERVERRGRPPRGAGCHVALQGADAVAAAPHGCAAAAAGTADAAAQGGALRWGGRAGGEGRAGGRAAGALGGPCRCVSFLCVCLRGAPRRASPRAERAACAALTPPPLVFQSLNAQQLAAASAPLQPVVRVLAGPGSGKTRVLVSRVAQLLVVERVPPWEVLAITFTKRAAGEIKRRAGELAGEKVRVRAQPVERPAANYLYATTRVVLTHAARGITLSLQAASQLHMGTFHSICAKVLRSAVADGTLEGCGRSSSFTILDEDGALAMMKAALARLVEEGVIQKGEGTPADLCGMLSFAKNAFECSAGATAAELRKALVDAGYRRKDSKPDSFVDLSDRGGPPPLWLFEKVVAAYETELRAADGFDFDDLLAYAVRALRGAPRGAPVRQNSSLLRFRRKFRHCLVDEFQDTNMAQYEFLKLLAMPLSALVGSENGQEEAAGDSSLFVVGDTDQSVYAFRGSKPDLMLNQFRVDFPDSATYHLPINYRSVPTIIRASDAPLRISPHRSELRLQAGVPEDPTSGPPVRLVISSNQYDEATVVAGVAADALSRGLSVAVLYRKNTHAITLEPPLIKADIPYSISQGKSFSDRIEVKDLVAYMTWLANPSAAVSFLRLLGAPKRGVGNATVAKLVKAADSSASAVARAVCTGEGLDALAKAAMGPKFDAKKQYQELLGLQEQCAVWRAMDACVEAPPGEVAAGSVSALLQAIIDGIDYEGYTKKRSSGKDAPLLEGRLGNVQQLVEIAKDFDLRMDAARESAMRDAEGMRAAEASGLADAGAPRSRLSTFLQNSLLTGEEEEEEPLEEKVRLMTLHGSKGLEFDVVLLVQCVYGSIPMGSPGDADEAEELRCAYVGMTRAKRRLYMIHTIKGKDFKGKYSMHRTSSVMENLMHDATADEMLEVVETAEAQMMARQLGFQSARALFEHTQTHDVFSGDSDW